MTGEVDLDDLDMECPCPCENCGKWFDLHDGDASEKWFPNTVICSSCGDKEREEIERDEEIQNHREALDEAEYDLKYVQDQLIKFGETDLGKAIVFTEEQMKTIKKSAGNRPGTLADIVADLCEKGDVY